jgi:hypothetical protein
VTAAPAGSDQPTQNRREAAAVLAGIVLAVSLTVAVRYQPYTFIRRDGSFYATIARGLVEHFSLDQRKVQPQSWYSGQHPGYPNMDIYWSNISVGRNGTWYPKHSFLISVAAAPFYALCGVPGFLIFNVLCVVVMLWAAYLLAVRFAPPAAAALAVLFIASCPTLVDHTYHLSLDVFNAALIAGGAWALGAERRRPALAGALLGLGLWTRPIAAPLVGAVAIALLAGADRATVKRFCVAAAVPLALAALANTLMYGAPWITAYDRVLTVENRVPVVASSRGLFTNSLAAGYRLMFEDREHGLVANALPALVAVAGLVPLARRSWRLAAALAIGLVGFVVAYIRYRYFNARFFFAWQVLLIVPLAALLADAGALLLRVPSSVARAARGAIEVARARVPRGAWLAIGGAVLVALVAALIVRARHYRLSAHVADARVLRDGFPCDYFNMTHLAWECSRMDRDSEEYTGLAINDRRCRFDGEHRRAILLGPPAAGGERQMTFQLPRAGRLELEFGVEAGAAPAERCLSVRYAGRPAEQLCAREPGQLEHRSFDAPGPGEPRQVELTVAGRGPRVLCVDGTLER